MFNLIHDAQSWGILILVSEIILILLGVFLLIFGPNNKSLKLYLYLGILPFVFGTIGTFTFYFFNNINQSSPFLLGIISVIPQLLIYSMGMLVIKDKPNSN